MKIEEIKLKDFYDKHNTSIYGMHRYADSVALLYHENSKNDRFSSRRQGQSITDFNNDYINKRASQPYKVYPQAKKYSFAPFRGQDLPDKDFFELVRKRRSVRNFADQKLTMSELYTLCQYTYGITAEAKNDVDGMDGAWAYRCVPSPGALYSMELYLVILNAEIPSGLYHYRPDINSLELIMEGHLYEKLNRLIVAEPLIELENAGCVFIATSMLERLFVKYGERAYRLMLLEAGALSQNLTLTCDAIGWGSCWVGSYLDDQLNEFMGIDGLSETVQNVVIVGKK